MIGEQLQRQRVNDGFEALGDVGQTDHRHPGLIAKPGIPIGEHEQRAAACLYFMQVGLELFEQLIVGRNGDHRHVRVNQRQGSVLELAGRVGLGMDIGDFLELQGAFQGNGILHPATEEQRVVLVCEALEGGFDFGVQRQHPATQFGQRVQRGDQFGFPLHRQIAARPGDGDAQQLERDQLGGEGLGRRHPDLGTRAGQQGEAGLPHQ